MEIAQTRSLPENTKYQQFYCLISHIPEPMKNSGSDTNQNVIRLYEPKTDSITSVNYKPKKYADF